MAGIADDHINRLSALATDRISVEAVWQQAADVAAPDAADFTGTAAAQSATSVLGLPVNKSAERSVKLYDATAANAVDRLASGLESVICPQSEYWHTLSIDDWTHDDTPDDAKAWIEKSRNYLFKQRYDADSGWINSIQTCFRRSVVFGNSFQYVDEGWDKRAAIRYRYMPLNECYVAEDAHGTIHTWYRLYTLSAEQAVGQFGSRVHSKIQKAAESATDKDRRFVFLQCVSPRGDYGDSSVTSTQMMYQSQHIDVDNKMVVRTSGYHEFPIIDYRWLAEPGRVYADGLISRCLADIQALQLMAKNELVAGQQAIDPPLLVANAGVMNRPNTNPGAINFGGMDAQGRKMIEPLFTGQRLDFATKVLEAKRLQIKESLYINLFATLVDPHTQSATEALIRNNEKGELLGPAGARFQQSLSRLVDREMGILSRRGMYAPDSKLAPPRSVQGRSVAPTFTSQIDRLRRTKEAEGTIRTLEIMAPLAQIDNEVVDIFDGDAMAKGLAEILGMPQSFVRPREIVAQRRAARQQQVAMAQNAAIAKDLAAAGKQGSDAIAGIKQSGML